MNYPSGPNRRIVTFVIAVVGLILVRASNTQDPLFQGTAEWFFREVPAEMPSDGSTQAGQRYAQALPALGRADLWARVPHRPDNARPCEAGPQPHSIPDAVAELARSTRIVIISEAHDMPWHRKFTESLLGPLWDQGYRYFAAEMFSERINDYPDEPFGRIDAGYYAAEPAFGSLIRTAKRLGYKLVPYEAQPSSDSPSGSISEQTVRREEEQANNLMERIFSSDRAAKVVIHVGYAHVAELPIPWLDGSMMTMMAARLKEKTGIDPLTIDQTSCRSSGEEIRIIDHSDRTPSTPFDLAIAYPEIATRAGRAAWRLSEGKRLVFAESLYPIEARVIIEARLADEPGVAIPVDRVLVRPGESIPLVLPEGKFRLTITTEDGAERDEAIVVE